MSVTVTETVVLAHNTRGIPLSQALGVRECVEGSMEGDKEEEG